MSRFSVSLLATSLFVLSSGTFASGEETKPDSRAATFTVSKEITFLTRPLTEDGFIDYAAGINQKMSVGVTVNNNAVIQFYRAHGPAPEGNLMPERFFRLIGKSMPPARGDYFLQLGKYLSKQGLTPGEQEWKVALQHQGDAATRPWTRNDFPHIAKWLEINAVPLGFVVEGTRSERYYSPLIVGTEDDPHSGGLIAALLPSVQMTRSFARALTARAMLNLGEGRVDDAWRDLVACHRLSRLVAQGPTLIEGLVGLALGKMATDSTLAFLQHAEADSDQIVGFLREIERLPPMPNMADKVDLTERCMFLDCLILLARGGSAALETLAVEDGLLGLAKLLNQPWVSDLDWDAACRVGNESYDRTVAAMRKADYQQRKRALKQVIADINALTQQVGDADRFEKALRDADAKGPRVGEAVGQVMLRLLLPAIESVQTAADRWIQTERNLHVAFGLAAFRSDESKYPDSLDPLSPKYLQQIPDDLFSGKSLIYRPEPEGYLLYSVGPNEVDEEGRWYDDQPAGDDPRVRMPRR